MRIEHLLCDFKRFHESILTADMKKVSSVKKLIDNRCNDVTCDRYSVKVDLEFP